MLTNFVVRDIHSYIVRTTETYKSRFQTPNTDIGPSSATRELAERKKEGKRSRYTRFIKTKYEVLTNNIYVFMFSYQMREQNKNR